MNIHTYKRGNWRIYRLIIQPPNTTYHFLELILYIFLPGNAKKKGATDGLWYIY